MRRLSSSPLAACKCDCDFVLAGTTFCGDAPASTDVLARLTSRPCHRPRYVALSPVRWVSVAVPRFCLAGSAKDEAVEVTAVDPHGTLQTMVVALGKWDADSEVWTACASFA